MRQKAQQVAASVLQAEEQLIWAGQPDGGRIFTGYDAFLIPFMTLWTIFWAILAFLTIRQRHYVALMGIAFVAIGLYVVVSRLHFKLKRRRQMFYAITDKRVMRIRRLKDDDNDVRAIPLEHIENATVSPGSRGIGTIYFYDDAGGRSTFFDVENSEDVFALYREQRKLTLAETLRENE